MKTLRKLQLKKEVISNLAEDKTNLVKGGNEPRTAYTLKDTCPVHTCGAIPSLNPNACPSMYCGPF